MNPRLDAVTLDCLDKHALAAFWCGLLGTTVRADFGQYLALRPTTEGHPHLVFQQVGRVSPGRSRAHLDLESHDLEADTARAVALGAVLMTETADFGVRWRTLADPEGNLFCLVPGE